MAADGSNIATFPTRLRVVEGHPQSNAGNYGFTAPLEVEPRERVEITAGLTKVYATRVDGMIWAEFATATNAIRCAEHLRGLIELGALFPQPPQSPEAA